MQRQKVRPRVVVTIVLMGLIATLSGCPNPTGGQNGNDEEDFTVTYDANGADSGSPPEAQTKSEGDELTIATNSGNLARTGYTFAGWNSADDGSGTNYAEGATYTADADLTLYARWTQPQTDASPSAGDDADGDDPGSDDEGSDDAGSDPVDSDPAAHDGPSDDTAGDDVGSDDEGSDDAGSDPVDSDPAADDGPSDDTAGDDTGSDDGGSDDAGSDPAADDGPSDTAGDDTGSDDGGVTSEPPPVAADPPVEPDPPDTTPPAEVTGLSTIPGDGEVTLQWAPLEDADFAEVRISWTPANGEAQPVTVAAGSVIRSIGGLTNDIPYTFTVVAVDETGNASDGVIAQAQPEEEFIIEDTTPPALVSNLTADPGDGQVTLSWNDPDDADLARVEVLWDPDGLSPREVAVGTEEYTATGLDNGIEYTFVVRSVDTSDNVSGVDILATPIPPDTTPPAEVIGLSAIPGDGEVTLQWAPVGDADFAEVRISWTPADGEAQPVTVAAGSVIRSIAGLTNDTQYTFTVVTVDETGNASDGVIAQAQPEEEFIIEDTTPPALVSNLTADPGDGQVTLSWNDPDDTDLARVEVLWDPDGLTPQEVAVGTEEYTATGLDNGIEYTFVVRSVDTSDNVSGVDTLATPIPPTDPVSIDISFDNPQEPTIAFTGVPSAEVDEDQVLTVEATSGFSSYEWLIDGSSSAALSVSGSTDNTAEIDTGELGLGARTITLIVDDMYSAQTSFTVVQP